MAESGLLRDAIDVDTWAWQVSASGTNRRCCMPWQVVALGRLSCIVCKPAERLAALQCVNGDMSRA